jgi:hypothetical protein
MEWRRKQMGAEARVDWAVQFVKEMPDDWEFPECLAGALMAVRLVADKFDILIDEFFLKMVCQSLLLKQDEGRDN